MPTVALADRLSKSMMVMAAALTFVLAIVILADTVSRAFSRSPLGGAGDIVGNAVVMIVFLQAGYAVRCRSMARADFILGLMPWPTRRLVLAAGYGLGALLFALLVVANWEPAITAFLRGSGPGFPAWPARFAILAGAVLATINYILLGLLDLTGPELTLEGEIADLGELEP
ncbi:MAG: TRAP transporter small permease [Proteobacteria bacterium]|nr:TRAP transporter small permease [Pseudomonadota bacterium]